MRWLYALPVVAACSFDGAGVPLRDAGFVDPGDDGGGAPAAVRVDAVEEWGADGVALDEAVVEPWGALGPSAWLTGGLLVRGSDQKLFAATDGDLWPLLAAATPDGVGLSDAAPVAWGFGRPRGIGVTGGDDFTVWWEGELWLEAGDHALQLYADDMAFVDLAPPGGAFARAIDAAWPNTEIATYSAPVDGWYGFRAAVVEGIGDAGIDLRLGGTAIRPEDLRVRADALTGLSLRVFDQDGLGQEVGWHLFRDDAFSYVPDDAAVAELGITDHDHWGMRWSGQLRIDSAATYTLQLDTDDGQRLWLDGVLVLDHFGDTTESHTTEQELDAGWHDLVVDLTDDTGGSHVELRDGTAAFPADLVRPVAARAERTTGNVFKGFVGIPDPGSSSTQLKIAAPTGATSIAVELNATIDHPAWADLDITVIAPDSTEYIALAAGASTLTGSHAVRFTVPAAGAPVAGEWTMRITDHEGGDLGSFTAFAITVRYRGGAAPIARTATWTSPIYALGNPVGIDAIVWAGRVLDDSVTARARTCTDMAECAVAPWSDPVTTSGDRPAVVAKEYAQIQLELASDGDLTPSIDWIELQYRAAD